MDPVQNFVAAFENFTAEMGKLSFKTPTPVTTPWYDVEKDSTNQRLLALENRLGEVHKKVDKSELRLDSHLSRISELEIRMDTNRGRVNEQ